ncbi:glycosyltransferase [bacterium]|nr:glycosyltransferase [bacterium]
MTNPLISVCVPTYNNELTIKKTLLSLIKQTYKNLEILVIDDCSFDSTVKIVESIDDPRVRLLKNSNNLGMTSNWNKCITESKGEFVKLICADDILLADSISEESKPLIENSNITISISNTTLINSKDIKIGSFRRWPIYGAISGRKLARLSLIMNNFFGAPCNVTFRKSTALKVGLFDENLMYIPDFDLWIKLALEGDVHVSSKELNAFRIRESSNTSEIMQNSAKGKKYIAEHVFLLNKYIKSKSLKINKFEYYISILSRIVRSYFIGYFVKAKLSKG